MNNYHYLIAGLPDLVEDYGQSRFDYDECVSFIKEQVSGSDRKLILWLETGFDLKKLSSAHVWRVISKSKDRFIKQYFSFDRKIREMKVGYLAGKRVEAEDEEGEKILAAFAVSNLIEREKAIDSLLWDKALDITSRELFSIDVILSFIVRAKIVCRWNSLDQKKGEELFSRLVSEVRGTFKGVNFNPQQ